MVITKSHINIINCLVNGVAEVKLLVAEAEVDVAEGGRHSNDDEITAQVIHVGDFRVTPKKIEWRDDGIHSATGNNNNKGVITDWIQLRWKPRDPMNDVDVDDGGGDAKDHENIYVRIIQIGPRFFQLNSVEEKKLVLDTYNGSRNDETSDASRSNVVNPSNPLIASSSASSASSNNNNLSTNPDNTSMADVLLQLKQFAQATLILHRQQIAWQTSDAQNNQSILLPPTQHQSPFVSPPSSPKEHEHQPNQYLPPPPPHIAEYERIRQQLESASDPTPLNDLIKSVTRQNQLLSSKFATLEKSYLDTTSRLAALQTRLSNREKKLAEKTMLIEVLETRAKAPQPKFPSFADDKIHVYVSVFVAILAILLWMWAF